LKSSMNFGMGAMKKLRLYRDNKVQTFVYRRN